MMDYTASLILPVGVEGSDLYDRVRKFILDVRRRCDESNVRLEVILVTDVGHKETLNAIIKLVRDFSVRALLISNKLGKWASIKNAIPYAKGKYIVILDADLPVSTDLLIKILLYIMSKGYDAVIPIRVSRHNGFLRRLLSIMYNGLINALFKTDVIDHQAGFKIISKELANDILINKSFSNSLIGDTELVIKLRKLRIKYLIIPVKWNENRSKSTIPLPNILISLGFELIKLILTTLLRSSLNIQRKVVGRVIELNSYSSLGHAYRWYVK